MNRDVIELLQDMVCIPSVNPFGDPGTTETGEGRISEYIAEYLKDCGADVEVRDVEPGRPNVVGSFVPPKAEISVALGPHMDTVSIKGMTVEPFGAEIRNGFLYGRGAVDTKGSMASFLAAVSRFVTRSEFLDGRLAIHFCALMGEESGNDGIRALMDEGFRPDFAVVGEPTSNRVVYTHKGALWLQLKVLGKTAHGSMPEKGESAILKMARIVEDLLGDYSEELQLRRHDVLGSPTINIGVISGGSQTNIVPGACEIDIDRRTLPGESSDDIIQELQGRLKEFAPDICVIRNCPALHTEPASECVELLDTAAGGGTLTHAPWFCDAGIFSEHGVPSVAFGPGDGSKCHTPDECIEVEQVRACADIMERFLVSCAAR